MSHPFTFYLFGYSGIGKLTISKQFAAYHYKIVDNHLLNNPIFSFLNLDGRTPIPENAWKAIGEIRKTVLGFISQDCTSSYIFTNELLETQEDHDIYEQIKVTAEIRNSVFIPVKLTIQYNEHLKRISSTGRKEYLKTTHLEQSKHQKKLIDVIHPNLLELDITSLAPSEVAQQILDHAEKIKNSNTVEPQIKEMLLDETGNQFIRNTILKGVQDYNQHYIGKGNSQSFNLYNLDDQHKIIAGASGNRNRNILYLNLFWVEEAYRLQGLGSRLLQKLEDYALQKNCQSIQLETLDWQARPFYEKRGFKVVATLPNWVKNYNCYIMQKDLTPL